MIVGKYPGPMREAVPNLKILAEINSGETNQHEDDSRPEILRALHANIRAIPVTRLAPCGSVALPGRGWQGTASYRWYRRADSHDGQGTTRTAQP